MTHVDLIEVGERQILMLLEGDLSYIEGFGDDDYDDDNTAVDEAGVNTIYVILKLPL